MSIDWLNSLSEKLPFQLLDYLVIGLNIFIFIFASYIIKHSASTKNSHSTKNRMRGLRAINLMLFLIYAVAGSLEYLFARPMSHLQEVSQTGLTILMAYIVFHYLQLWVIHRFGKEKEINGEKFKGESYASEIVGLIGLILVASIVFLIIINIWRLNDWLQATSVIGGVLLILFASKDYFLGDMISGLIMHYNHSVEAGAVVRVKELNLTGVVMQITLSQTIIRDLVQKHEITVPNAKLRNATVETISNSASQGFRDFVDFQIGYNNQAETVINFLEQVWQQAAKCEAAINSDTKPKIVVTSNGDHAVTWRLLFYVKNPYRLHDASNTIQTTAFELAAKKNIGLNTPVTHQIYPS